MQKPLHVHKIAMEVAHLLRASLPKTVEIKISSPETIGRINGNAEQIYQVFINLCINAYHALPEEGGRIDIHIAETEIHDEAVEKKKDSPQNQYLVIDVVDNGKGMEPEILKSIFSNYFTTKPEGSGSGIGLTIVRDIISKHHGDISVCSQIGKGSRFRILLPLIISDQKNEEILKDSPELVLG
ncbi:MAG: ATP-binding protein [Pseudomonadota bacterium]